MLLGAVKATGRLFAEVTSFWLRLALSILLGTWHALTAAVPPLGFWSAGNSELAAATSSREADTPDLAPDSPESGPETKSALAAHAQQAAPQAAGSKRASELPPGSSVVPPIAMECVQMHPSLAPSESFMSTMSMFVERQRPDKELFGALAEAQQLRITLHGRAADDVVDRAALDAELSRLRDAGLVTALGSSSDVLSALRVAGERYSRASDWECGDVFAVMLNAARCEPMASMAPALLGQEYAAPYEVLKCLPAFGTALGMRMPPTAESAKDTLVGEGVG